MRIHVGLLCVLFSFIALSVGSALSESLTYDEVFYLEEGRRIWSSGAFSDPYNPPLAPLLGGVPATLGFATPTAARLVSVGLGVLLILAVYHVGGLTAALLVAFEPTILANSHYVTNDIAVTLFVFLAAIAKRPLLLGLGVGYALSSKMTSLVFLPIMFSVTGLPRQIMKWRRLAGTAFVSLMVLWASYLFTWDVVIREREDAGRLSTRIVAYVKEKNVPGVEKVMTFFQRQPLPLGTYLATIKNNALRVGKPAMIFFDGTLYDRSRWYFMIVNVLRKVPIPFLLLVGIGAWYQWRFALIGGGIVAIASMLGMVPLVRYVMPAMPFLALVGARGIREIGELSPTSSRRLPGLRGVKGMVIVGLLLWYVGGTIVQYPHFISYANAFAGPRDRRFEVLADSNLDWGQALPDLTRYVQKQKIGRVKLSYFGRDDEHEWRFEEICAFKSIVLNPRMPETMTAISISNWYYCGYNMKENYKKEKIQKVVSDVFLIF